MLQFRRDNETLTFLNLPSTQQDINVKTLTTVLQKSRRQFQPFNKSIATRVLYPQLCKRNFFYVAHMTRDQILQPSRFSTVAKIFDARIKT